MAIAVGPTVVTATITAATYGANTAVNAYRTVAPVISNEAYQLYTDVVGTYLRNADVLNQVAKGALTGSLAGATDQKTGLAPSPGDIVSYYSGRFVFEPLSKEIKDLINSYSNSNERIYGDANSNNHPKKP